MDWPQYKALCDQPRYFSQWMLCASAELFELADEPALAERLQRALGGEPLPFPDDHTGPEQTRMFLLELSAVERDKAAAVIAELAANDKRGEMTRARGLGGFVEAWQEYAEEETRNV